MEKKPSWVQSHMGGENEGAGDESEGEGICGRV